VKYKNVYSEYTIVVGSGGKNKATMMSLSSSIIDSRCRASELRIQP